MKCVSKIVGDKVVGQQIRCPACGHLHFFHTASGRWKFNGDQYKPTFTPSLRNYYTESKTGRKITICHLTVTDGMVKFHDDNPHKFNGQTVELPDLSPDDVAD